MNNNHESNMQDVYNGGMENNQNSIVQSTYDRGIESNYNPTVSNTYNGYIYNDSSNIQTMRTEGRQTRGIKIPRNARVITRINFVDAMRLVAEGYVMWRYSAPSAQIRNLNINNINETKLVVERERLIGPIENPQLIVNLTHRGVNTSPGELQISHTFSQIVTNESSYSSSRSITNTFGIEQGLEVEFKLPALGNVGSTTTLKYEYSNTIENLSSQSKSVGWQYEVSATGILPPHTSADLYTRLYKTKTRYEQTGYSYFEGTMSFEYLVDLPGAQWNQLTISLREIGGRINENIEQRLYKEYYMYFSSYEDPTSGQLRPALAYNGLFYLDMDDSYYAETGMTSPNRI